MSVLAEVTWPEAVIALTATCGAAWTSWLSYRQALRNAEKIDRSTILTRSTDEGPNDQIGALHRRQED